MFIAALDSEGKMVKAIDAIPGVDYYCPHCGARMRVRRYHNKVAHFYAPDSHHYQFCEVVEREKYIIRTPAKVNKKKTMKRILTEPSGGGGGGGGGGGDDLPDRTIREMAASTLEQMYLNNYFTLPADDPIEDGVISDLCLSYWNFPDFLASGEPLGGRILLVQPHNAYGNYVRFLIYWKNPNGGHFRHFLHLHVADPAQFEELAKMLFFECNRGKWSKRRYDAVVIGGDWKFIEQGDCGQICPFCKDSNTKCTGTHMAHYTSPRQIFCPEIKKVNR
jgi:hypothetical protein